MITDLKTYIIFFIREQFPDWVEPQTIGWHEEGFLVMSLKKAVDFKVDDNEIDSATTIAKTLYCMFGLKYCVISHQILTVFFASGQWTFSKKVFDLVREKDKDFRSYKKMQIRDNNQVINDLTLFLRNMIENHLERI